MADNYSPYVEIGSSGLRQQSGMLQEEFLRELRGNLAAEKYREMAANDPVIGVILFVIEQMISQVAWAVKPVTEDGPDREIADFVDQCLNDMSFSWNDTLSEIGSMFTYGWAFQEIVYKQRLGSSPGIDENGADLPNSKFFDRKIGWRKWALRGQETLQRWYFDDGGGIQAMEQTVSEPFYKTVVIPIDRALLFRTRVERNNPQGVSLLRKAYRPWFYCKRFQEIEAIGIERDLAGLPVLKVPAGLDLWNQSDPKMISYRQQAEKMLRSIRRGEQEGIILPGSTDVMADSEYKQWRLELLTTGSRRQFDLNQVIERYETRMAMSALADFIFLGQKSVGSFALSTDKTEMFTVALKGFLQKIVEPINRYEIPRLLKMNGIDSARSPSLSYGDVERPNIIEHAQLLTAMTSAGAMMFPDESLERYLRGLMGWPEPEIEPVVEDDNAEDIAKATRRLRDLLSNRSTSSANNFFQGHSSNGNGNV